MSAFLKRPVTSLINGVCSEMRSGYVLIINISFGYCVNFSDPYSLQKSRSVEDASITVQR